jgi:hypothetical protein
MRLRIPLLLALLIQLACRSTGAKQVMDPETVKLVDTQVSVQDGQLRVSYAVTNGTQQKIYLVNRLFHRQPSGFVVDTNLFYTEVAAGGVLRLVKARVKVPDDMDVEVPEVPYLTELSPGQRFAETATLPLPLEALYPYRPRRSDTAVQYAHVQLEIGWVADIEISTVPVAGRQELRAHHHAVEQQQRLLTSKVLDVGVAAKIK